MEPRRCSCEVTAMRTQSVALVNGTPEIVTSLESLFEGGQYEVMFPALHEDAYLEIKRLRPGRVVLCITLENRDALQLLTMLRLDGETRDIPVIAVTPHGECSFAGLDARSSA